MRGLVYVSVALLSLTMVLLALRLGSAEVAPVDPFAGNRQQGHPCLVATAAEDVSSPDIGALTAATQPAEEAPNDQEPPPDDSDERMVSSGELVVWSSRIPVSMPLLSSQDGWPRGGVRSSLFRPPRA